MSLLLAVGAGADREEQAHTSALEFTYLMRKLMDPPAR